MIVTAPFRSGATKFCLDQAELCGLRYVGEIDKQASEHFTLFDKARHHETGQQPWLSFDEINDYFADSSNVIILNNTCNPALFAKTNYFLTRKEISKTYHSLATLLRRAYPLSAIQLKPTFKRHSFQIGILYSYLKKNNITPLYFEDLYPDSDTDHESYRDPEVIALVEEQLLKLSYYGLNLK